MKVLILALFLACASAQYLPYGYYGVPIPTASQFHAQDVLGQASFGYAYPGQAATNYRDAFGNQVGSYAYINPNGKEVRVSYVADSQGFRVLSNDLPQSPVDEGKAPIFEGKAPVFEGKAPVFDGKAPEPVQDTPETIENQTRHLICSFCSIQAVKMKVLILSVFLACASAQYYPGYYGAYPGFTSQYHSQDAFGQAAYGYAHPGQAASNYRDAYGNQVGSYAYLGPQGKEVRVNYVADALGFRVLSNNLPVAPEDTPEVAAAKAEHAKLVNEALAKKASEPASRTKRQVPFYPAALPYTAPYFPFYPTAPAPLVAKTTVKTVTAEADLTAKTPADTNKFDLKEKSYDVVTPLAYHTPYFYSYPFYSAAAPAAAAPVATESSRKKRQVIAVPAPTQQFLDDLKYKSVDLNQNGMPDNAVVPVAPAFPALPYLPYSGYAYSTYYPTAYPFVSKFY
ncbi:hypothetical protein GHT06_007905 [Daphnia sinensis]|uniref:Cuticular protein n=1 Tax=Daphnia sinensis TaxID=1820382 RepID=A0AAD5PYH7_9CRUS|nr:hypothetical protein GHT06_007905 [Daphnia sinensis]